jgi:adenylate cyclase
VTDRLDPFHKRSFRLPSWLDPIVSIAVTDDDTVESARTKRLAAGVLWITLPITVVSSAQLAFVQNAPIAGAIVMTSFFTAALVLVIMGRSPGTYPDILHLIFFNSTVISMTLTVMAGGLLASGVNAVWGFATVLAAVIIFADGRATFWLGVLIVSQVAAITWSQRIEPVYEVGNVEYVAAFNLFVVVVLTYFVIFYFVRQRRMLLAQSDALLANILPEDIAERLKTSDDTIADDYASASVLFADVVDFTPMSAGMEPAELVGLLDEVFSAIDGLVDERDLEKIKTIGDAYMVAAGVPEPRSDHAAVLCDLALAIHNLTSSAEFGGHRIQMRIGINSGPVVAGIIGTKKFSYDLWGDTVNTASRMESSAAHRSSRITEATLNLVEDSFVCEPEGIAEIKGKGAMEVWRLVGRR